MKTQITHDIIRCDVCKEITTSPRTLLVEHQSYDICSVCESKVDSILSFVCGDIGMDFTWEWGD